ncbi:hypothetical protein ACFL9T_14070 [Thermodesulfobacteriota bacterium]
MKVLHTIIAVAIMLSLGCSPLGPKSVPRDRFDYNKGIARSWKEQTLLNIVKLRYADMPLFVDVASVVAGYSLEGSVSLGGTVSSQSAIQGDFLALGTSGKYTDRPTITYAPITGQKFNESFMTPIPPRAILFLMQSGWPVDMIFPVTVDSINGLRSRIYGGASKRLGDPGFYRVVKLLREIQKSGAAGMRIIKGDKKEESTVLFFYREKMTPEIKAALQEVNNLLGLRPGKKEVKVIYGSVPENDLEMAMLTRSMMQIMVTLATQIDVPPEHVSEGQTIPSIDTSGSADKKMGQLIKIKSSRDEPEKAFVAVKYENHWFWIDKRDFYSKRVFAFLMILFSLTETGSDQGLPLVTIPAS